jgi:hypothetical protein
VSNDELKQLTDEQICRRRTRLEQKITGDTAEYARLTVELKERFNKQPAKGG